MHTGFPFVSATSTAPYSVAVGTGPPNDPGDDSSDGDDAPKQPLGPPFLGSGHGGSPPPQGPLPPSGPPPSGPPNPPVPLSGHNEHGSCKGQPSLKNWKEAETIHLPPLPKPTTISGMEGSSA